MGGNALKNVETRRIPAAEYYKLCEDVVEKLRVMGSWEKFTKVITSYSAKSDFGDMDVLVAGVSTTDAGLRPVLKGLFGATEIVINGSVISFDYKGFQIDLICTPHDEFEISNVYYNFNDLGNLIGKTARNLHLKYGHKGLYYTVRDGIGEKVGEVLVSRDPKKILTFLGYDWNRWSKGFKDLKDIFEFAASSKYFTAESYALDKLNHVDRIRDRKRKTYTEFLEWLETTKPSSDFVRPESRTAMLGLVREAFPNFGRSYDLAWVNVNKMADVKRKFNGQIVSTLTGLEKKELGQAMETFRRSFESEAQFQDYVLYSSPTTLAEEIKRVCLPTKP